MRGRCVKRTRATLPMAKLMIHFDSSFCSLDSSRVLWILPELEWLKKLVSVLLFFFTSCLHPHPNQTMAVFLRRFRFFSFPAAAFRHPISDPLPAESWPSALE
jgi:hypothetical protein